MIHYAVGIQKREGLHPLSMKYGRSSGKLCKDVTFELGPEKWVELGEEHSLCRQPLVQI